MPWRTALGVLTVVSGVRACCDEPCIKRALISEAEGGMDALGVAVSSCCKACPQELALQFPGRCLEVIDGLKEEHRNVAIWDCDPQRRWFQLWNWVGEGKSRALKNAWTGKCLHVYSYALPARLEQSSDCTLSLWEQSAAGRAARQCIWAVRDRRRHRDRKDKDVNYSVPSWASSTDKEWITFAGKANGARVSLGDCTAARRAEDGRQTWRLLPSNFTGVRPARAPRIVRRRGHDAFDVWRATQHSGLRRPAVT